MPPVYASEFYEISAKELSDLVSASSEKPDALAIAGGTAGLAAKIKTDTLSGLSGKPEDIEARRIFFGKNFVDGKPPKTLLALMWQAAQDFTLVMLMISATVSLILGISIEVSLNAEYSDVLHTFDKL